MEDLSNEAMKSHIYHRNVVSFYLRFIATRKMKLIFYTTQDCHLCEQAAELLNQVTVKIDLEHVDIAGSVALVEKYGIRIPVIKNRSGDELGWPFDLETLENFIREENKSV